MQQYASIRLFVELIPSQPSVVQLQEELCKVRCKDKLHKQHDKRPMQKNRNL